MKEIELVNAGDMGEALKSFALTFESALSGALQERLNKPASAACTKAERKGLGEIMNSEPPSVALEVRCDDGVSGTVLLVIQQGTFIRLGAAASEGRDGATTMDAQAAVLSLVGGAFAKFHAALTADRGIQVRCSGPGVVNPDGSTEPLLPLTRSFEDAYCLTFTFAAESLPESRMLVFASASLIESLDALLRSPKRDGDRGERLSEPRAEAPAHVSRGMAEARHPSWNVDLILDVELDVVVAFGKTEMPLKDVLRLGVGSVIELDRGVNDPVDLIVNDKTVASGEVVMVDGNYGVRVTDVKSTAERIRSLG